MSRRSASTTPSYSMRKGEWVESGRYNAKPTRVFPFEDLQEAHRVMESNEAKGKMVIVHD